MTSEQVWLVAACAAALGVALVALLVALRSHARARRAEAHAASVSERLAAVEAPAERPSPTAAAEPAASAYVITGVGADAVASDEPGAARPGVPPASPIDGRLFADIVARETVVKAASWTHGLRRALAPETRNRIRFEVRQEAKRAGRGRRAEMKQALREFRAREREALRGEAGPAAVDEDVA
ncbi:hypothetical protein [Nocardioides xinjiangensis]|uniref:hypothetical protein n=1 Tax=Nocardioides xinjiangensis TaxID=2817376 RepID=UPI001B3072CC|nr:hypothetical protein [Nocardioides sp. SYSU D00778]